MLLRVNFILVFNFYKFFVDFFMMLLDFRYLFIFLLLMYMESFLGVYFYISYGRGVISCYLEYVGEKFDLDM